MGLLLCRVTLGEVLTMTTSGKRTHAMIESALASQAYNSVMGIRKVSSGSNREFVLHSMASVYPEYVILYKREFTDVPTCPTASTHSPTASTQHSSSSLWCTA